ncbi:MAG TPA: M56 family metallopeptidase [Gemmatimonadaceae bacterium]|nr:M56 family metallopeptidase [Gemmatimonadaceae bacterium]
MSTLPFATAPLLAPLAAAALKGAAVLVAALGVTRLLRGAPAAVRHAVWCAALAAQVALLPLGAILPAWHVPVPAELRAPAPLPIASELPAAPDAPSSPRPTEIPAPPPRALESRAGELPAAPPPDLVRGEVLFHEPRRTDWNRVALLIWGAGSLALLARLAMSALAVARLERRSSLVMDEGWLLLLDDACEQLGISRPVRLLRARGLGVPVTWGARRPAVVLPDGADEWPEARRRVVLLHELAHVKRLDVLTQTAGQLAVALFWPDPLVWLAAKRSRAECERACDDCVLDAGTKPSRYVEDLVDIVRSIGSAPAPAAAALAMARRSEFEGRVLAILDPAQPRATTTPRRAAAAALLAAALVLPLAAMRPAAPAAAAQPAPVPSAVSAVSVARAEPLPQPAAAARPAERAAPAAAPPAVQGRSLFCAPEGGGSHSNWTSNEGTSDKGSRRLWRVSWTGKNCSVELRAEGELKFNADFTDIESISEGGLFEASYRAGDALTRLEIRPVGRGRELERHFAVNGTRRESDAEAREWLAALLAELDLQTGFAADARFPRMYREGGAEAVLSYVPRLRTDYARNRYLMQLLSEATLDREAARRVMRTLRDDYDGDYERTRALVALVGKSGDVLDSEESQRDYLEVAAKVRSDYERTRALMLLLDRGPASPEIGTQLLRVESATKSDFELARVLVALVGKEMVGGALEREYLRAAGTIESDFERARVLLALLGRKGASTESVAEALALTRPIKSDFEKARVLVAIASSYPLGEESRNAYREVARGINSEFEYERAMRALPRGERTSK